MVTKKNKIVERTRRSNGEGSLYKRKDGRWGGSVYFKTRDGKNVRKHFYGRTEMEVLKKMSDYSGSLAPISNISLDGKTFGELLEDWLLVFKKASVSPRTFEGIFRNFRLHIQPVIGNMKLNEINSTVVQRVVNKMLADGYSVDTCKKIKFTINQFFEYAIDNEWAQNNPTTKVRIRNRDAKDYIKEEYKAIPSDIRQKFLSALNHHELLKPICMVGMFAGLRIGEILALRWQNIDFENKIIQVNYGITQIPKFDDQGNILSRTTVIGDTKTSASVREVPMPDILVDALKEWRKVQWIKKEITKKDLISPQSLVFCNYDGSVRTYSGTRHIFNRFLKRHNLDMYGIQFHTLRHTYSSMLFESGENPKIIQALLGHKSVNTTLTVYNSVDKSYFKQATERLNDLFNKEVIEKTKITESNQETKSSNVLSLEDDEQLQIEALEMLLAKKREQIKKNKNQDIEM